MKAEAPVHSGQERRAPALPPETANADLPPSAFPGASPGNSGPRYEGYYTNRLPDTRFRAWLAWLGIIASAALVSGCAVAMLGGAARSGGSSAPSGSGGSGGSGSASTAGRPASQVTADNAITAGVRARFAANASLKSLKLVVGTYDGVVTLRGQVNNVEQRNAAQLEARAVKGVKSVKNELTVR